MYRADKEQVVADLTQVLEENELVVVTRQAGLTVKEMTDLRRRMREVDARYKVIKNRLARRALDNSRFADIAPLFVGPTAIAYSKDPVAAARVAVDFAKSNEKLEIAGGALGELTLDVDGIKALAALPSLDELRAKLVGMLQTPATRVAGVLQAPAGQLARVMSAYGASGADA